jgi:NACalpha-BTF3-like transcription factor
MEHCKITKAEAIKALREADGDKVNAILKYSDK